MQQPKNKLPVEKPPKRRFLFKISIAFIALIFTVTVIWLEGVKSSYRQDIKKTEQTYLPLENKTRKTRETKLLRADFFKKVLFANAPLNYSYGTSNFIRQLSLLAQKEIGLLKLEIKPYNHNFAFVLKGKIKASNQFDVKSSFSSFYRKLKALDDMLLIDFSILEVKENMADNPKTSLDIKTLTNQSRGKRLPTEMFFSIKGEIELE